MQVVPRSTRLRTSRALSVNSKAAGRGEQSAPLACASAHGPPASLAAAIEPFEVEPFAVPAVAEAAEPAGREAVPPADGKTAGAAAAASDAGAKSQKKKKGARDDKPAAQPAAPASAPSAAKAANADKADKAGQKRGKDKGGKATVEEAPVAVTEEGVVADEANPWAQEAVNPRKVCTAVHARPALLCCAVLRCAARGELLTVVSMLAGRARRQAQGQARRGRRVHRRVQDALRVGAEARGCARHHGGGGRRRCQAGRSGRGPAARASGGCRCAQIGREAPAQTAGRRRRPAPERGGAGGAHQVCMRARALSAAAACVLTAGAGVPLSWAATRRT